jgi:ABC-type transport system substrate-binding protein
LAGDTGDERRRNLTTILTASHRWVDNTHVHFTWRQGVKFHDGVDFNSDAVQAYYKRVLDPATKSPRTAELRTLDRVESADAYNSTYVLKEADAVALDLAFSFWNSCFPSPAPGRRTSCGTGPFIPRASSLPM